jgi:fatty-acyl-CoA synthase
MTEMDTLHCPPTPAQMIAQALSTNLERPVIMLEDGSVLTARDIRDSISRYSQLLRSLDPKPKRAALLSKNRPEVPGVQNSFRFADIIATSLHPMGSVEDYLYVVEHAQIDTLIYDDAFEDTVRELKQRAPGLRNLFSIGKAGVGASLSEMASGFEPGPLVASPGRPEDVAGIAFTGGTTGKPKGVLTTNAMIAMVSTVLLSEFEWPKEVRHLVCSPLSHAGASVLAPILILGGSMFVLPSFDPVSFMEAIEKHRITTTLMVPTMVLALIDHPRFAEFDLSSLESIYYGASAFPPSRLKEAIEKLGPIFLQFYGQSEAPLAITVLKKGEHLVDDPLRLASCGRPHPFVTVALLDDDGNEVPDGEPGEICARGPQVMAGYLDKPEETAEAFKFGWLHTGDVAVRNPDGFLRIVDRKKDMIVSGGFNVFAREVENVIAAHPGVAQVAVIGVPHEKWGEAVTAIVVAADGASPDPAELMAMVREEKGPIQAPKAVHFVDSIPLSAVGKPDKKALKVLFAGD